VVKNLLFLCVLLLIGGCCFTKKIIPSSDVFNVPEVTGSLVNKTAFERGGSLVVGVFKPGSGAAANEETDGLSSMLMKGVKETLINRNARFTVAAPDQNNSEFALDGYIQEYTAKGHKAHLSLDGEIYLRETGEKVFLFQTSFRFNTKNQDPMVVAYRMGEAIADRIINEKETNP